MAILTQTKFLPSPINRRHTSHSPILRTSVHCSITAATTTKSNPTSEKLVLKPPLEPSPSPSPSPAILMDTTICPPSPNDPSLQSTWSHRAWVASGCTTVLVSLAKSITCAADSHIWLEPILAGLVGHVLADLGSGVYHWDTLTLTRHTHGHHHMSSFTQRPKFAIDMVSPCMGGQWVHNSPSFSSQVHNLCSRFTHMARAHFGRLGWVCAGRPRVRSVPLGHKLWRDLDSNFCPQIEAFQGHHKWHWTITRRQFAENLHALARVVTLCWPWTIIRRQFAENLHALARVMTFIVLPVELVCDDPVVNGFVALHALARVVTFIVLPVELVCDDPVVNGFVAVCSGSIMFSQQFHAWAHGTKSRLLPVVVALQDLGVLVSRPQHAAHHRQPYNNNYCIVSGVWNEFLDQHKVFEALEMNLFFKLGLRPRSWSEPSSEWTEETETASQLQ